MINSSDLMEGNYFYPINRSRKVHMVDETPMRIAEIKQNSVMAYPASEPLEKVIKCTKFNIRDIEPIVLTEDMLVKKCGALKSYNDNELHFDRFRLFWKKEYKYWYVVDFHSKVYMTKVEFLHEWQNFIKVINGQKLDVKL